MVVATNTRDKRYGRFLEILGFFNPNQKDTFNIDKEKFEKWKNTGALVSKAVNSLINKTYKYVKYNPKTLKESKEEKE